MSRFTLVVFDRYEASHSEIVYHDTATTDLKKAFIEALTKHFGDGEFLEDFEPKASKKSKKRIPFISLEGEETSYLFYES